MSSSTTVIGNLTRDPELKFSDNGFTIAKLSLADNRKTKDSSGNEKEEVSYFNVVVFGTLADNVANSLHKGNRVIVQGRFQQRDYTKTDGTKVVTWDLIADAVGPELRYNIVDVKNGRAGAPPAQKTQSPYLEPEEAF